MTPFFPCAHAAHPLWPHAVKQVIVQLQAQVGMQNLQTRTRLGMVYVSAAYAPHAHDILTKLSQAFPAVEHWVGSAAHAVLAGDMDYGHCAAIAVMLPCLQVQDYQVFSGVTPWHNTAFEPHAALVHGDAFAKDVPQQIQALRQKMPSVAMVGGLSDLHHQHAQWSWGRRAAGGMPDSIGGGGVQVGGFSGVVFSAQAACMAVGMQGCKAQGVAHTITRVDGDVVLELDGRPALEVLFGHMDWATMLAQRHPDVDEAWRQVHQTMVAMTPAAAYQHGVCLSADARVMRVVGIDPLRQGVVLDGRPLEGGALVTCQKDEHAMRADMRRACAEVWESMTAAVAHDQPELTAEAPHGRSICGAIYIRNVERCRMPRSPQVDAELQWIRHALGPVPLLGFTSSHEIHAGELQHLSAQLLVFTQPLQALL